MSWSHISWRHILLHHFSLRHISFSRISWCHRSWCHISWCHISWHHISWRHISWLNISWCHITWHHISWCHDWSYSFFFWWTQHIASPFCHVDHIFVYFSLLNSSDIKMVPQYCLYGFPGMPATIFVSDTASIFFWILRGNKGSLPSKVIIKSCLPALTIRAFQNP